MSCWRIAGHGIDTVASAMRSRAERPSTVASGKPASPSMSCAASARECAATFAMPMSQQVVDGGAEADDAFDVRRAGFVAERRLERLEAVVGEHRDHAAADVAEPELGEPVAAHVEHADAVRPEHLVAREAEEVHAERVHVDRQMRDGLRRVDEHGNAGRVRGLDPFLDRRDRRP